MKDTCFLILIDRETSSGIGFVWLDRFTILWWILAIWCRCRDSNVRYRHYRCHLSGLKWYVRIWGWRIGWSSSLRICVSCCWWSSKFSRRLWPSLLLSAGRFFRNIRVVSCPRCTNCRVLVSLWYWSDTIHFFLCLPLKNSTIGCVRLCCSLLPRPGCTRIKIFIT